jgi:hypothetical protein
MMHQQKTLILDEDVYDDLASAYQAMATDTERERDALEWSNALIGDVADAAREIIPAAHESHQGTP